MKHQTLVGLVKSLVLIGQTDRQIAANVALSILSNSEIQQQAGALFRRIAEEQLQSNDGGGDTIGSITKSDKSGDVTPPSTHEVVSDKSHTTMANGLPKVIAPTSPNDDGGDIEGIFATNEPGSDIAPSSPNRSSGTKDLSSREAIALPTSPAAPEKSAGDKDWRIVSSDQGDCVPALSPKRDSNGTNVSIASRDPGFATILSRPASSARLDALTKSRLRSAAAILFKVHDGRDVMELKWRELSAYRVAASRESAILSRILNHARPPADPTVKVREVISIKDLKRFMEEADKEERERNAA
jgi:hypothetical protein